MRTIDPSKLSDYVNRKIYKYESFHIEVIELDAVLGEVEYRNTIVYGIKINDVNEIVNLDIDGILLFETMEEAKMKQALDVHALYIDRMEPKRTITNTTIKYYRRFIDSQDKDFFILNTTNYQMDEEEYRKVMDLIRERHPEYLI